MPGVPGLPPFVLVTIAGLCLTLVYFTIGLVAYVLGHRTARERVHEAGRTLPRLSPVPFLLGGVAAVLLVLGIPVLSVTSALDDHAVE